MANHKMTLRQSLRETAHRLCIALLCVILSAGQVFAGSITLLGVGGPAAAGVTYTGPGDVVASATVWGSCARVYQASIASTSTSLCDLVDSSAPTVVICTLRGTTSGYVDLVGTYCTGSVTPATKCAAATGAKCNVSKVYNQVSPGTLDWTNATAASQPTLTFSALNGLPGLTFVSASATVLTGIANITQAQPFSMSAVYERTSSAVIGNALGAASGTATIGPGGSAGQSLVTAGTNIVLTGVTESVFHAIQGVFSSTIGANNTDGADSGSTSAGAGTISATTLRIGRSATPQSMTGIVMEVGMWPSAFNSTQRTSMNTNQHSATVGYNF